MQTEEWKTLYRRVERLRTDLSSAVEREHWGGIGSYVALYSECLAMAAQQEIALPHALAEPFPEPKVFPGSNVPIASLDSITRDIYIPIRTLHDRETMLKLLPLVGQLLIAMGG